MKAYNHLFVSLDNFKNYLDSIELDRSKKYLIRLHTGVHTPKAARALACEIQSLFPQALIIGCSTSRVICEGKIEQGCLISITELDKCDAELLVFSCEDAGASKSAAMLGREVSEELVRGREGMLLLFFPLTYLRIPQFVDCMNRSDRNLKMVGGTAYISEIPEEKADNPAFVIAGTEVYTSSMAAVLLTSPSLSVYCNTVCGVESIGQSYEVTKAHEDFVDEIEGTDCAEWYEEQLGREELDKNPLLAGIFPLVYEKGDRQIARNVIYEPRRLNPETGIEEASRVRTVTEISPGFQFALGYFDPAKIVNQLTKLYEDLKTEPVEVLFAYGCLSRMWMLHDCAKWEVSQFYTTNMCGAIMAGEISYMNGENVYANATFVVAGLSESRDARLNLKSKSLQNVSALQHDNVQMINYLLQSGNRQLSRQLSEQQDKMQKAMFYHAELGLYNQTKYLYDRDRMQLDKIAVFNLKNERLIKLFIGRKAFFNELSSIYREVEKSFITQGFQLYIYGECSLLVAAESYVDDTAFRELINKIYSYLTGINYKEFMYVYECVLVMREQEPLQKAETALQYVMKNKLQFIDYSDIPQEIISIKEEMHILQVVREALVQDRIIPYFQGIYDNRRKKIGMYEALMRIKDGQGNIYYPNQFLPIAKEYNLYEPLSIMMVKKVMEMFLDKKVKVTINLNVQDIYDRDMIRTIFEYLEKAQYPENYVFELVESEGVQDYQFIKQFADSIHEHGAGIAIDDFGSGFSNLLHIVRIDADIIKVDGTIVREINRDTKCREFIELLDEWCTRQSKELVAEFVENEDIQAVLEQIGISCSQGYYFAIPKPWEECMRIAEENE